MSFYISTTICVHDSVPSLYPHKSDRLNLQRLKFTEEQGVSGTSLALPCRLGDWIRARVAGRRAVRSKSIQRRLRTAIVDLRASVNKGAIKHGGKEPSLFCSTCDRPSCAFFNSCGAAEDKERE